MAKKKIHNDETDYERSNKNINIALAISQIIGTVVGLVVGAIIGAFVAGPFGLFLGLCVGLIAGFLIGDLSASNTFNGSRQKKSTPASDEFDSSPAKMGSGLGVGHPQHSNDPTSGNILPSPLSFSSKDLNQVQNDNNDDDELLSTTTMNR